MRRPSHRPLLLLVLALLLAGATAAAARFGSGASGPGEATRGERCDAPDRGGPGYTVAEARGSVIAGLTVRPGAGARPSEVVLQLVGPNGPLGREDPDLRLSGGGQASLAPTTTPGCYVARLATSGARRATIGGLSQPSVRAITLSLPPRAEPVPGLAARIRQATSRLGAVREVQRISPSRIKPPVTLRIGYSGRTMVERSRAGLSRAIQPGWRGFFFWMIPGGLDLPTRVGWTHRNGRRLAVVNAYVKAIPAWLELLVDPRSGFVYGQRMLAAGHFMTSAFSGFRPIRTSLHERP